MAASMNIQDDLNYDAVLKDVFFRDRPTLLNHLTGGVAVKESLNVEFPTVLQRRCDLLFLLETGILFLLDFQSNNDPKMPGRVGIYGLLAHDKYLLPVEAWVLYTGAAKLTMKDTLDIGIVNVKFRILDIREIDAESLIKSGRPGDLVLAMLAGGGVAKLRRILKEVGQLQAAERDRALAQMALLAGLRKVAGKFKMEVKNMGLAIDIDKNEILREIRDNGRAEGRAEGQVLMFSHLLRTKFGAVPEQVEVRVKAATSAEIERWTERVLVADSLQAVFGKTNAKGK